MMYYSGIIVVDGPDICYNGARLIVKYVRLLLEEKLSAKQTDEVSTMNKSRKE